MILVGFLSGILAREVFASQAFDITSAMFSCQTLLPGSRGRLCFAPNFRLFGGFA
jgi:hypothetical protein